MASPAMTLMPPWRISQPVPARAADHRKGHVADEAPEPEPAEDEEDRPGHHRRQRRGDDDADGDVACRHEADMVAVSAAAGTAIATTDLLGDRDDPVIGW